MFFFHLCCRLLQKLLHRLDIAVHQLIIDIFRENFLEIVSILSNISTTDIGIATGPLKRCLETADIIYPDRYVKRIDNIAECNFGEFENKTADELIDVPEYKDWLKGGFEACAPSGESFGDFTLRCLNGLEEIFKDMIHDQVTRAAVITHGGVIMNLLSNYGLPKCNPSDFALNQGEGYMINMSTFLWQHGPTFEIVGKLF